MDVISLEYDQNGSLCHQPNEPTKEKVCTEDEIEHKLNQTLWPDHCVMNTPGANFGALLKTEDSDLIIKKGFNCEVISVRPDRPFEVRPGPDRTPPDMYLKRKLFLKAIK